MTPPDRRGVLAALATLGLAARSGTAAAVTTDDIARCMPFAGLEFTPGERAQMAGTVDDALDRLRALRAVRLDPALAPAETFDPRLPGWTARPVPPATAFALIPPPRPSTGEGIAMAPAWAQAAWLADGQLGARALTEIYLARIVARAPRLACIATLCADSARAEAEGLDRERAAGKVRGPLHGLPYGLKDLIDAAGVRTVWGAEPYRAQIAQADATIVRRLRAAGAILLAKTSCGALAYGDIWYGGRTRNPWNTQEGSSGSSAGSAAAVADGLCAFAIGTETMGSIMAPAARCGTVGLRPTFGRVARTGAMPLCWSLDKIGPLARSARDVERVLAVLNGTDGVDPAARDAALPAPCAIDPREVRLGYRPEWFAAGTAVDRSALAAARDAGFRLVPVTMPATDPRLLGAIVVVEAAAAFEELTLDGRDDTLRWQDDAAWPNSWRAARFEPAIGYVQAQRLRRRLMIEFAATMAGVDAILHPNTAAGLIAIGNHCGYPALALPAGTLDQPTRAGFAGYADPAAMPPRTPLHRVPFGITLTGNLYDEAMLVAIGERLERALAYGSPVPPTSRRSPRSRRGNSG